MIAAITEAYQTKFFFAVNVGEKTVWGRWVDKMDGPGLLAAQARQQSVFMHYAGASLLSCNKVVETKRVRRRKA